MLPLKAGVCKKLIFISIYFDRYHKDTDVGFRFIPGGTRGSFIATFDSSTTQHYNINSMAYTNNVNYGSYSKTTSKMNARLRQLAILSAVVLVGMIVSISVNA
jgi:hypothetical protein